MLCIQYGPNSHSGNDLGAPNHAQSGNITLRNSRSHSASKAHLSGHGGHNSGSSSAANSGRDRDSSGLVKLPQVSGWIPQFFYTYTSSCYILRCVHSTAIHSYEAI